MNVHQKLGYIKIDALARKARHNFWRDTYRSAFRRRVIEAVLIVLMLSFIGAAFVYLAFSVHR